MDGPADVDNSLTRSGDWMTSDMSAHEGDGSSQACAATAAGSSSTDRTTECAAPSSGP
ncbi:hypothetical protein GCM10017668_07840 [Streptomyces tuirus]|uniref:Uncharacterized protein n=1 Tax=Streptomyces tuirus TaxID=68278 RepID=A0A7G1N883_9ACTN|nr:hypothetical protein GCM10017668_07840 [Streptomyces tuirus]